MPGAIQRSTAGFVNVAARARLVFCNRSRLARVPCRQLPGSAQIGLILAGRARRGARAAAAGGFGSGSLTLLGAAGPMFSDSVALALAALAAWVARRPPSARHSYGVARAAGIAAVVKGPLMRARER